MYSSHRSDTQSSDDEVRGSTLLKSKSLAAAALLSMWDKSGSNQPMSKPNSPQPNRTISSPGMVPFDDRVERRARSMDQSQTEQVGAVPQGAAVSGPSCAEQAEFCDSQLQTNYVVGGNQANHNWSPHTTVSDENTADVYI